MGPLQHASENSRFRAISFKNFIEIKIVKITKRIINSKLTLGEPSLAIPTSLVATPLTDPSSWKRTSLAAYPGYISTPNSSACSPEERGNVLMYNWWTVFYTVYNTVSINSHKCKSVLYNVHMYNLNEFNTRVLMTHIWRFIVLIRIVKRNT